MADGKSAKPDKRQALRIDEKPGVARDRQIAEIFIDPAVHSMATCVAFGETALGKVEITETLEAIEATIKAVRKGDLSGPEAMLVSQSHSLNAIFTELARRSALNMGQYIVPVSDTCGWHSRRKHSAARRSRLWQRSRTRPS